MHTTVTTVQKSRRNYGKGVSTFAVRGLRKQRNQKKSDITTYSNKNQKATFLKIFRRNGEKIEIKIIITALSTEY